MDLLTNKSINLRELKLLIFVTAEGKNTYANLVMLFSSH